MYKFIRPVLMGFASWGLVVLISIDAGSETLEEKSIPDLIADAEQGDVESQWFESLIALQSFQRLTSDSRSVDFPKSYI